MKELVLRQLACLSIALFAFLFTFFIYDYITLSTAHADGTALHCSDLFTVPMQPGDSGLNVKLLQQYLIRFEDIDIPAGATGYYGTQTKEAVSEFQIKYSFQILFPLKLVKPTGIAWYQTLKQINALYCG